MKQVMGAPSDQKITLRQRVFRGKGNLYPDYTDPKTGKMIPWPGGQWLLGREGHWFNAGIVHERVEKFNKWRWLMLRMRMELQGIKLFFLALLKRRL